MALRSFPQTLGTPLAPHDIDWGNPTERELVDFTINQFSAGRERRERWARQARLQLAWLRGNQNMTWSPSHHDDLIDERNVEEGVELPLHRRRPVTINMLKRFVMSWMGLLIGGRITWHVFPQTNEETDISLAKVGEDVLQYYWRRGVEASMTRWFDAMWHMWATGMIFMHPYWDVRARFNQLDRSKAPDGDIRFEFTTGFEITEPRHVRSMAETHWLIESRFRTIEWGLSRFGSAFADIHPDESSEQHRSLCPTFEQYGYYGDYSSTDAQSGSPDERVLVHRLWRPACDEVPEGHYSVIANNRVVHSGPHPYRHGRLPYIAFREQPDFDHFRPGCTIRDLIPLQWARNKQRAQTHAHFDKSVDPRILAETGSGLPDDFFLGGPKFFGEVTQDYVSQGRIKAMTPPDIPAYVFHSDEVNRRDMEDMAGMHSNTMGRPESADQSGRHAALMTQGDVRTNVVTKELISQSMSEAGGQILMLAWEFVDSNRLITITGVNEAPRVQRFKGGDGLTRKDPFGPNEFNVRVTIGTEPSMEAVWAQIDMLLERGLIDPTNPRDRISVLRMLNEEVPDNVNPQEIHANRARLENELFKAGNYAEIMLSPGDDDSVHVQEHQEVRPTPEWRAKMKELKDLDITMEYHIQAHLIQAGMKQILPQILAQAGHSQALQYAKDDPRIAALLQALPSGAGQAAGGTGPEPQRASNVE